MFKKLECVKTRRKEHEKSGIYEFSCNDCDMVYYGQTRRRLETREKEHNRAIRNKQIEQSAVARHYVLTGHTKKSCRLVKQVTKNWELDAYESLFISSKPPEKLMNTGEPPMRSLLFKFCAQWNIIDDVIVVLSTV